MTEKCPFQFDLMNPMTYHEGLPFEAFATLRQQCPVSYQDGAVTHARDFWAITKSDDLDFVSKNPDKFSSRANLSHPHPGGDDPESLELMRQVIINMDPPNHIKYRRVRIRLPGFRRNAAVCYLRPDGNAG